MNLLLQMAAKPVKNASSLLYFSGHSELETGLLYLGTQSLSECLSSGSENKLQCGHSLQRFENLPQFITRK